MATPIAESQRLHELLRVRRGWTLVYEVRIAWQNRAAQWYIQADREYSAAESGENYSTITNSWLVGVGGGEEELRLAFDGASASCGDLTLRFTEDFGEHLSTEEPAGRWAQVYARSRDGGPRVMVYEGPLDVGRNPYDRDTGVYELAVLHPWTLINDIEIPGYRLSSGDLPNCPGEVLGDSLPIVIGSAGPVALMLISDLPAGTLAAGIGPDAATAMLEDASGWPDSPGGGLLDGNLLATDGMVTVKNIAAQDWPRRGLIKIGNELIGYGERTYIGATVVQLEPAFRDYGRLGEGAAHNDGDAVVRVHAVILGIGLDNQELAAFTDVTGTTMTFCGRGLFGTASAHNAFEAIECIREVPIIHGACAVEASGIDVANIRGRSDERPIMVGLTADVDDASTISGQTIASITADAPLMTENHMGFQDNGQQSVFYGAGDPWPLPFRNYWIPPLTGVVDDDGVWANQAWGHDENYVSAATGTQIQGDWNSISWARWQLGVGGIPGAFAASITAGYIYYLGQPPSSSTSLRFRVDYDIGGGFIVGEVNRLQTDEYGWIWWGLPDELIAAFAAGTVVSCDVLIGFPKNPYAPVHGYAMETATAVETGVILVGSANWGWTNPGNAIDSNDATFAEWASVGVDQMDGIYFSGRQPSNSEYIVGLELWIRHQEPGSVAGDWTARHVRVRFGTESDQCGTVVEIPLRNDETVEGIWIPLPADAITDDIHVEIFTQAAMGITMRLFSTHLIVWTDESLTNRTILDRARDLTLTTMDGAVDSDGALVQTPSTVIRWLFDQWSGLNDDYFDEDSFTDDSAGGLVLSGQITRREALGSVLARISGSGGCCPYWHRGKVKLWRWPSTSDNAQWQFVAGSGPANAWGVNYDRTDLEDVANIINVRYSPRPYSSESRVVRGATSRPPPAGGRGHGIMRRERHRLALPYTVSAQAGGDVSDWRYGMWGWLQERDLDADFIGDAFSAAVLGAHAYNVHGRRRWIVTFECGPEGELIEIGSLGEWIDERLPWPVLEGFHRSRWWEGAAWKEDEWPRTMRGFYAVCLRKRRASNDNWTITIIEWCSVNHPDPVL